MALTVVAPVASLFGWAGGEFTTADKSAPGWDSVHVGGLQRCRCEANDRIGEALDKAITFVGHLSYRADA